ncbi:hypothetical protein CCP4SC76_240008 [Gammaproteobacteria bacterium]
MASKKMWVYCPPKKSKPKVPDHIIAVVQESANNLIETSIKPQHVKPHPEDAQFNYIVDIYSKWYRSYFYFCAKYRCPSPNCIAEFFETKFARMEYVSEDSSTLLP